MTSSAITDKLETGILIFVTQPIFHGCRLHVTGGPWWMMDRHFSGPLYGHSDNDNDNDDDDSNDD